MTKLLKIFIAARGTLLNLSKYKLTAVENCGFLPIFVLQKRIISVKIIEVVNALERFAPLPLQAGYDNAGLQIGLTEAEVSGALLCLDVTEEIVEEAVRKGCNLIVSHHPLIFHKLARIAGEDYVQRTVMKAIENHVAIVSMHTNMDSARGGVNYKIAEKMRLADLRFFGDLQTAEVPGTDGVQAAATVEGGEGVMGRLPEEMAADDFVLMLKREFNVECVMANELLRRPIRTVAVCGGAGAFLQEEAVRQGADAFVTGEMHYHEYFGHEQEIQIAVIGHYQSEQYTNEVFREIIERECPGVKCCMTEINTNPIIYL
jgi:dinuclear metal center YbgI/SA1388 family protein